MCNGSTYAPAYNKLRACLPCQSGLQVPSNFTGVHADKLDVCQVPPGKFWELNVVRDCPKGLYRANFVRTDDRAAIACLSCPPGWTTANIGSIGINQCNGELCHEVHVPQQQRGLQPLMLHCIYELSQGQLYAMFSTAGNVVLQVNILAAAHLHLLLLLCRRMLLVFAALLPGYKVADTTPGLEPSGLGAISPQSEDFTPPPTAACPMGFYYDGSTSNMACVKCPYGSLTLSNASTSSNDCMVPPGYYVRALDGGGGEMAKCPTTTPGTEEEGYYR